MWNRRIAPRRPGRAGLSLLELLVALALLSLIAGGIAAAFGMGAKVYQRALVLNTGASEIAARRQLRRYLLEAIPPGRITSFPLRFEGRADALRFVTLAPTPFAPQAAALEITVHEKEGRLTMIAAAIRDDGTTIETWTETLSTGVRAVQMRYLEVSNGAQVWHSTWAPQPLLPALVRITAEGGTPDWVTFSVAPRLR